MKLLKKFKLLVNNNKFIFKKIKKVYKFFVDIKLKYFSGNNKDIFTSIYLKNKWGDKDSFSGTGSNLDQTKVIIEELPKIIKKYKIKSILDIPCGDFYWMKEIDFKDLNYIGADIVSEITDNNNKFYGSANINFYNLDLLNDKLPYAELIFCRDCLVHLSFDDIFIALNNIKETNSKFLITTNFFAREKNQNISTGGWRTINLCKYPFNFPEPILTINENCTEADNQFIDKSLSLWELDKLPDLF